MVLDKDVKSQLIVLNEAFLVLSDTGLKSKYDYALSNPSALTTPLESEIAVKHQKATDFIDNKLAGTKKGRKNAYGQPFYVVSSYFLRLGLLFVHVRKLLYMRWVVKLKHLTPIIQQRIGLHTILIIQSLYRFRTQWN